MIVSLFLCIAFASAVAVGDASAPLEERLKRLVQARDEMEAKPGTLDKQRRLQRQITRLETQLGKNPDGGARPTFDVTRATSAVTSNGDSNLSMPRALLSRILPTPPDVAQQKRDSGARQYKRRGPELRTHPEPPSAGQRPQGQIIDGDAPQPVETHLAAPITPKPSAESRVGWSVRPPVLPTPHGMGGSSPFLGPQVMMAPPQQWSPEGVVSSRVGRASEQPQEKGLCSFDPQGLVEVWDSPAYPPHR